MLTFLSSPPVHQAHAFHGRQLAPLCANSITKPTRLRHPAPLAKLPDVVIIGGGLAGLSTAHELSQRGASVTILSTTSRPPAGLAAAGMLAPTSEGLNGPLRALCQYSRALYPSFTARLHALSGIDPRYVSRADFLIPLLSGQDLQPGPDWLSEAQVRMLEPALGPRVVSARRVRGDAHVDNRLLMSALRAACEKLGTSIRDDALVQRLVIAPDGSAVDAVLTEDGECVQAGHFVLASGAWSRKLLPGLPVRPVKGQMLALRARDENGDRLNHVLYGHDVYVVPKRDGSEFFVGATVEDGTFSLHNTAAGVAKLLNAAVELVPAFGEYEIAETWSGLRPATPDLQPVLGMSEFDNMSIATGYYRNGILLAPATAKIAAATALNETSELPQELRDLVPNFSVSRFLGKDSSPAQWPRPKSTYIPSTVQNNRQSSQAPQPHAVSTKKESSPPVDLSEIKVWRILPDGTREPVFPANRSSSVQEAPPAEAVQSSSTITPEVSLSQPLDQPKELRVNETPAPENVSGKNDAYEDIMQHREDAEKIMSEALAANRAFGRKKSSLEKDGGTVLSLSEEEVIAFDVALEQGLQDMKEAEQSYDEKHASVIATEAEKARISTNEGNSTLGVNGVSMPLVGGDKNSTDTTPQSEGYF